MKVVAESVKMNDSVTVNITQNDGSLIFSRVGERPQTSVWDSLISTYDDWTEVGGIVDSKLAHVG